MNKNNESPIGVFLSIYSLIYKVSVVVASFFVICLVAGCLYELKNGDQAAVASYLSSGGVVIISTIRFFLWAGIIGIFLKISSQIEPTKDAERLKNASKLLLLSFGLDVINKIYVFSVRPERTDWDTVTFPHYDGNVVLFLRGLMSYFFKITVVLDGFLLPSSYGLATLMLALAVREWAKRRSGQSIV
jgi:hypothetical protein